MLLLIGSIALALIISAICSIMETCLLSLSTTDIAGLSVNKPYIADIWKRMKQNIQKPIAVILIVNTLAHTIGAAVSGAQFNALFGSKWIFVYSLAFSFVMIQWTEILPKSMAVAYNRLLAPIVARILQVAMRVFTPLLLLMEWLNSPFDRLIKTKKQPDALGDITMLARFASYQKLITREQENIVSRSIKLSNATVRDIMVPRDEIKYLTVGMSMADALIESHIHHHTRYLLIEGTELNNIIGFVNVKDIMSALQINPSDPSLKGIARPVFVVEATQTVPQLLKKLTRGYQHMAVVKNNKGKTVGVVTLEDVVEAIVGEIEDEYDVLPTYINRIAEGRFMAGGGATLQALKDQTGFGVPDGTTSLNEWLCGLMPGNPAIEMKIPYQDIVFTIRRTRRSRIYEVIVNKKQ